MPTADELIRPDVARQLVAVIGRAVPGRPLPALRSASAALAPLALRQRSDLLADALLADLAGDGGDDGELEAVVDAALADETFSGFSYYDFYPAIQQEHDPKVQQQMINALWRQDIAQWTPSLDTQPNISYWIPFFRDFNGSHCLTIVDFSGTGIEDQGYADVSPFINANLGRGAVMRKTEVDQVTDLHRPLSTALVILSIVLTLFG